MSNRHIARIRELEAQVRDLEAGVRAAQLALTAKGQLAAFTTELEAQVAKAASWAANLDPCDYVASSETSGVWQVGDLLGDFQRETDIRIPGHATPEPATEPEPEPAPMSDTEMEVEPQRDEDAG